MRWKAGRRRCSVEIPITLLLTYLYTPHSSTDGDLVTVFSFSFLMDEFVEYMFVCFFAELDEKGFFFIFLLFHSSAISLLFLFIIPFCSIMSPSRIDMFLDNRDEVLLFVTPLSVDLIRKGRPTTPRDATSVDDHPWLHGRSCSSFNSFNICMDRGFD